MGINLGFDAPSSQVVALALRHAILPKRFGPAYKLNCEWGTYGKPEHFYTDGGKDFRSNHLKQIGVDLGFTCHLRDRPSEGGVVERPFRTLNDQLFSTLPGYTGSNVQERPEDAEKDAVLTLRDLEQYIEFLKYRATKGTVSDFRGRTLEVLKGCEVEMLVIDEADRLKPETFADVRDFYDKLGISVVLVGTDRLDAVIKRDEQVYNRFQACHRFGKLSGEDFLKTVRIWEQKVLKLPVASNLTSKAMLKPLLGATEGYIGRMDEVLRESAIRALTQGMKKIEKSVLQEVAREYK